MQFLEGGGGHLPQMPHPGSAIGMVDLNVGIYRFPVLDLVYINELGIYRSGVLVGLGNFDSRIRTFSSIIRTFASRIRTFTSS